MHPYRNDPISISEYSQIRESSDSLLEYMDGFMYMAPSPSTKHQRISSKLQMQFGNFLEGTSCEVFAAPYDIELQADEMNGTKIVIPDISIICDQDGFTENRYVGVPSLIAEILIPSNQSHDVITKLNLYMTYGVKEYWIVNPMLNAITVYALNAESMYEQYDVKRDTGHMTSKFLDHFSLDLEKIFSS